VKPDELRATAQREVGEAFARFLARTGEPARIEYFAEALAGWVYSWCASVANPHGPSDPAAARVLEEKVQRVKRDLELLRERETTDDGR
jgi:hypothetical protein